MELKSESKIYWKFPFDEFDLEQEKPVPISSLNIDTVRHLRKICAAMNKRFKYSSEQYTIGSAYQEIMAYFSYITLIATFSHVIIVSCTENSVTTGNICHLDK